LGYDLVYLVRIVSIVLDLLASDALEAYLNLFPLFKPRGEAAD